MKKIGFIFSGLLVQMGFIFLYITVILEKTIPIIGKMFSQLSDTKRYGETMYLVDYNTNYLISILLIIGGIVAAIFFYKGEKV